MHVLEVVGDEQRQRAVKSRAGGRPRVATAVAHQPGQIAQVGDGLTVVFVLAGDARRAARASGFERRVYKLVLILQVQLAHRQKTFEQAQHCGNFGVAAGVGAADLAQRVAHEQAQCLVDTGIDVGTAGGLRGACGRGGGEFSVALGA